VLQPISNFAIMDDMNHTVTEFGVRNYATSLCNAFHTLMFVWDDDDWVILRLEWGDELTVPFEVMGANGRVIYGGHTTIEHCAPKSVPKNTARAIWNSLARSGWSVMKVQ